MPESVKVFISYATEDYEVAKRLYDDLKKAGVAPWLDREDLLTGQNWRNTIPQIIRECRYILLLISSYSVSKQGYFQKEQRTVLELLDEFQENEIFIIPARLDKTEPLSDKLGNLHLADLSDYDKGFNQILKVFKSHNSQANELRTEDAFDKGKLEYILSQHKLWLKTGKQKGQQASLIRANLQKFHLQGVNFFEANLEGVNLQEANLEGANLEGANLQSAHLFGTNFENANLEGADLCDAYLRDANLRKANLKNANLQETDFHAAALNDADFQGANLFKANLRDAILQGANLEGANLENADLSGIRIDRGSALKIPENIRKEYGNSFFVSGWLEDDKNENLIIRSIEFPPEHHQAGISILNFFGSVLRKKYPDKKAKVKIEQDGLKVTMIIEPVDGGDREIIEKELNNFGLVVTGQKSIEEFSDNKLLLLELKTQLRITQVQFDMQKELLNDKNAQIEKLLSLVGQAVQREPINIFQENQSRSIHARDVKHSKFISGDDNEFEDAAMNRH